MRHLRSALAPILIALACLPGLGHAARISDHVAVNCSADLTIDGSDALSLHCAGNLSLSGEGDQALIEAKNALLIAATGDVLLSHLTLSAPDITIRTDSGSINIASDVVFDPTSDIHDPVPQVTLSAGTIVRELPLTENAGLIIHNDTVELISPPVQIMPIDAGTIQIAVPEPTTSAMLAVGLIMLLGTASARARRQR